MQRIVAVMLVLIALLGGIYLGSSQLKSADSSSALATDEAPDYGSQLDDLDRLVATDHWHFKISINGLVDLSAGVPRAMWPQIVNDEHRLLIERTYAAGTNANAYTVAFTDGTSDKRGWKLFELRADGRCMISSDRHDICESMTQTKRIDRYKAIDERMSSIIAIIAPREQS